MIGKLSIRTRVLMAMLAAITITIVRDRIFERLVRLASTASTTPGSGLGLPIARGYAQAMGGDVVYWPHAVGRGDLSPAGRRRGAAFRISLPAAV